MQMKAWTRDKYGSPDVLQFRDVETPAPGEREVLVRVHATSLNAYDWRMLRADPILVRLMGGGLVKPRTRIPGVDIAGKVEAVGRGCSRLQPGDAVFGEVLRTSGGCAEYAVASEDALAPMPSNLSFEQASAVPMAGVTALQGLRDAGRVQPGQKVLINGASGGVGTFAVQLAKHFGAEVTAVCSTGNMEMVRSLGADHAIDYRETDFTRSGQEYDLILGVNGYHSLPAYKRALTPRGAYIMAGGANAQLFEAMFLAPLFSNKRGKRVGLVSARRSREDLLILKNLLEAGTITPEIDRCFPFSQAVDALWYLDAGHAKGKVVVTVAGESA
jgi:NADPH:quinone reductase-like Zn-dependent oxidoreductase